MADNFTRGTYSSLPGDDTDLLTPYTGPDYTDVSSENDVRVGQSGSDGYAIHEFKVDATIGSAIVTWNGQTSIACSVSALFLQVYNQITHLWETLDYDDTNAADLDFSLIGNIANVDNYVSGGYMACRVYQYFGIPIFLSEWYPFGWYD